MLMHDAMKKKSISATDNMAIYDPDTDSTVPAANS